MVGDAVSVLQYVGLHSASQSSPLPVDWSCKHLSPPPPSHVSEICHKWVKFFVSEENRQGVSDPPPRVCSFPWFQGLWAYQTFLVEPYRIRCPKGKVHDSPWLVWGLILSRDCLLWSLVYSMPPRFMACRHVWRVTKGWQVSVASPLPFLSA